MSLAAAGLPTGIGAVDAVGGAREIDGLRTVKGRQP